MPQLNFLTIMPIMILFLFFYFFIKVIINKIKNFYFFTGNISQKLFSVQDTVLNAKNFIEKKKIFAQYEDEDDEEDDDDIDEEIYHNYAFKFAEHLTGHKWVTRPPLWWNR